MPQRPAGCRIEPPVSLPSEPSAIPAATATALPLDEPPGVRVGSTGLRAGPNAEFSPDEPIANSSMFVLPTSRAPAFRRRTTAVASYGGRQPCSGPVGFPSGPRRVRMREAHVVGASTVQRASLIAMGTPASGPSLPPAAPLGHGGRRREHWASLTEKRSGRDLRRCARALLSPPRGRDLTAPTAEVISKP